MPVRHPAWTLVGVCLLLAALSLLYPSSPTYDPWSWIVWGREVMHLDLNTVDGPSWKPLPVLFTAPFSLFGQASPALWLVIARAGDLAAVVLAFAVARRISGSVAGGAAAAAGLILAPWLVRNSALGNSEGLMVACVLAAVLHHVEDRRHTAFWWGVAAALLRPEAWPFLGLYGLWLLYTERREAVRTVAWGWGLQPVLWLLPELWGSGNLFRAADRAQQPLANSAAFSNHPALKTLQNTAALVSTPVWIALAIGVVLLLARRIPRDQALNAAGLAALALAWAVEVAIMTSRGFSGNQRYLITPGSLAIVAGGIAVGWLLRERALAQRIPAVVLVAVAGAAFLIPDLHGLKTMDHSLRYQGRLPHQLADAVREAGGAAKLRRCGDPYTGAFLVPAVAWALHVHTHEVQLAPKAPAVVFRVKNTASAHPVPPLGGIVNAHPRTLVNAPGWRIVAACR